MDFKEGFRRLFLIVSIILFLFSSITISSFPENKLILLLIDAAICSILYYSFYLWVWLFSGFKRDKYAECEKIRETEPYNYGSLFLITLILFIFAASYNQSQDKELKNLKNKVYESDISTTKQNENINILINKNNELITQNNYLAEQNYKMQKICNYYGIRY